MNYIYIKNVFVALSISLAFCLCSIASAEEKAAEVEADSISYIEKESTVVAEGNVSISYDDRNLLANSVIYNQNTNTINAKGNIRFDDSNGSVYFAEKVRLNDKLTEGTIDNLSGYLSDKSLIAAKKAEKINEKVLVMDSATYSPCKICSKKNNGKPLWSISASKIKIDETQEKVSYRDVTFDVLGFPVLYTPYLSHPTPSAKRKSGILVPTYSTINTLGATVKIPYYFNIAQNIDATFEPIFTSEEGIVLSGNFRHLLQSGSYEISGSITNPKERDNSGFRSGGNDLRGHIDGNGLFSLSENLVWGFDVHRSTDDTYLQRYKFGNEDLLTSSAYLRHIKDRNYLEIRTISFQGLNAQDNPDTTPLILPLVDAHFEYPTEYIGSRFTFDGNSMILARSEGAKSRRISGKINWILPYVSDGGHVFELKTSVRGDVYSVENVMNGVVEKNGAIGRAIPEVKMGWTFPITKKILESQVLVEPTIDFIISPNGGNPDKIPNEDSQELELSDVNLFSGNRFTGIDRLESGARANYGIRANILGENGNLDILLGQNYRAKTDSNFTPESGLDDNFSDYVGRLSVSNNKDTQVSYRFRIDKDDFAIRRNEVVLNTSFHRIGLYTHYVLLDEKASEFDKHEVIAGTSFPIADGWSFNANGRRDISQDGGWRSAAAGVSYENECLKVQTQFNREFLRDRDIEPSTSITLVLSFKNLGQI